MKSIQTAIQNLKQLRWDVIIAIILSTFAVVVERYQSPFNNEVLDHLLFFGLMPLLSIVLFFRKPVSQFGIQLGNVKIGTAVTAAACLLMALVMSIVTKFPDFQAYYTDNPQSLPELLLTNGLDLLGWEFLFRGYLLFALTPVCGPYAILLQAVPFTIAHIGKPELETYSCIFGGAFLGWLAWKTRSFVYPFVIHWFLATITVLFARGF